MPACVSVGGRIISSVPCLSPVLTADFAYAVVRLSSCMQPVPMAAPLPAPTRIPNKSAQEYQALQANYRGPLPDVHDSSLAVKRFAGPLMELGEAQVRGP